MKTTTDVHVKCMFGELSVTQAELQLLDLRVVLNSALAAKKILFAECSPPIQVDKRSRVQCLGAGTYGSYTILAASPVFMTLFPPLVIDQV